MIESLTNAKIKHALKLKQKKYRNEFHEFLVDGNHLVEEAYKTGNLQTVYSTDQSRFKDIETFQVTETIMKRLSELGTDQGIVGVCQKPKSKELSDNILILDHIQDPGNMGTLIRTAAAFGFDTIISEHSVDYYNEKVIRSSQGGVFHVDIREENILDFIKQHPEYTYYGTEVSNGHDIGSHPFKEAKRAIVLGNEGNGVRDEVKQAVNINITIPMASTESLNVGIAGGILMFEAYRRK